MTPDRDLPHVTDHTPEVELASDDSTADVLAANLRMNLDSGTAGVAVAEGMGGVGGLAAGAVVGSLVGPIGTLIGAVAGALGGWWAGREVSEAAEEYGLAQAEPSYRDHFGSSGPSPADDRTAIDRAAYERARPLYQLGHMAALNPQYAERPFSDVEGDLGRGWSSDLEREYGPWHSVRDIVAAGYAVGRRTDAERDLDRARQSVMADMAALDAARERAPGDSQEPG